jgi:hypothetical protein
MWPGANVLNTLSCAQLELAKQSNYQFLVTLIAVRFLLDVPAGPTAPSRRKGWGMWNSPLARSGALMHPQKLHSGTLSSSQIFHCTMLRQFGTTNL